MMLLGLNSDQECRLLVTAAVIDGQGLKLVIAKLLYNILHLPVTSTTSVSGHLSPSLLLCPLPLLQPLPLL